VDLADASAVAANTIRRAEVAEGPTTLTAANDLAIRRALEEAGVVFIDENGGTRRAPSKAVKAKAVRIGNVRSHVDVATVGHT
jgi:hypothetical protein